MNTVVTKCGMRPCKNQFNSEGGLKGFPPMPGPEHTLGPVQWKKLGVKHLQFELCGIDSHQLVAILSKLTVRQR